MKGFGSWRLGKAAGIVYAFLAFWLWSALSALQAPNQDVAWKYVEELTKIALPFLVGITTITSVAQVRMLAWVIVVSQGYIAYELNLDYYQGFNRLAEYGFGGLDNNGVAIAMDSCVGLAFFLGLYSERWWQKASASARACYWSP